MRFFLLFACVGLLASCNRQNLTYDKPYFDFDSLVNSQVQVMATSGARVMKKTFLNRKNDSLTFLPDTTHWKHELEAFQQLDIINKPSYKGQYLVSAAEDSHSNLLVRSFATKMKSPVPEVKFFYQDGYKKLKRIESVFNESNVLYSTARILTLEFDQQQGTSRIVKYRVQGFQKMILSDSVTFSITGKLMYP